MPILSAYVLPHPPLAVPEVGRGEEKKIKKTLAAFDGIAAEIAALSPDTVLFITPHGVMYSDYFHISPGAGAKGSLARFNAQDARFEVKYDQSLAKEIAGLCEENGIPAGFLGEKDASLDHGVMVPMWFINRRFQNYSAVRISQSGMEPREHYRLGQIIAEAAEKTGRRAVLVASGDLSHKLGASGPYGFAPEGERFDKAVTDALSTGDFLSLLTIPDELRERAAECGYNSFMVLAGCFDRLCVTSRLLSYEGTFGVGYAVAGFQPGKRNESRNFLDIYTDMSMKDARKKQDSEDCYRALARRSLEFAVKNGKALPLPGGLPDELLKNKAGAFVSLHKNGRLRGCVGTISPTTGNIALEIIQNAVSAGLNDNRFEPVSAQELPLLAYKVDILSPPEAISGPSELDVKRYGVIVSSGSSRGLLLPNLDGVDTVEQQVDIARRKGGIPDGVPVRLERFEVTRHE
ncbi:MAG: AmmeMemoRadiSam system protein A [Oscillospiraceae bacterium]|nr:AmmeMemoRadiSam system protein A [Oscillospiraceae bacterium]